jgi:hypothetical protein
MKIRNVNAAMLTDMRELWNETAPARPDQLRSEDILRYLMMDDGGDSQWYVVEPATVLVLTNVQPGLSADFLIMNGEPADWKSVRAELQHIMREFDLRRLNWTTPANVTAWFQIARKLGFEPEGRLKDGLTFDLDYVDAIIFGLHRSAVESFEIPVVSGKAGENLAPKKKRRRRRSRRKKKKITEASPVARKAEGPVKKLKEMSLPDDA